ncbi:MAG: DUF1634 domain-containing protein [Candidatus Limnocylindrales bacterium]|jgi:uncharacterized membrane protein
MKRGHFERTIGLVLAVATVVSVALLAIGAAGMAASSIGPLDRPFPQFDVARLPADVAGLRLAGLLWLGLLAVILTPSLRVVASLVGFAMSGERRMAGVALVVLAVICLSAAVGAGG